eukprot:CAMPEP_0184491898 /NCGR_PEP_ID=MMETSP0113_2-20130426/21656_1 /TAXON_ID=91329 /ORGANISM="Norrisiella sphaerica, Strain BC52" /LENGTH=391 /DNA_ID=CAMNT_0026876445 /DNA_START=301 /DNA_END=1476 /DNA_ORIENTATION=+
MMTPRTLEKADRIHMQWSRMYYWKASKARCMQRMIIACAIIMSAGMLYFDTEHLPKKWANGEDVTEDEKVFLGGPRSLASIDTINADAVNHVATGTEILILMSPGESDPGSEEYAEKVKLVLETWGTDLTQETQLVFLHCTEVAGENIWCPPQSGDASESFIWALRQSITHFVASKWVMRVELGTYVLIPNLISFLSSYDSRHPVFLGKRIVTDTTTYNDPTAGYILSMSAILKILGSCEELGEPWLELSVRLAQCGREAGIRIASSRAPEGGEHFNSHGIVYYATEGQKRKEVFAKKAVTFYHEDIREARWFHSVAASRGIWAKLPKEKRIRAAQAHWESNYNSGNWGSWLLQQLPGHSYNGNTSTRLDINEALLWDLSLERLVINRGTR